MTATIETAADIGVNKRLSVVFGDLQRAVGDLILKHGVTFEELVQAVGWTTRLAESGDLEVVVAGSYPLADVATAHRAGQAGHTHGKLVLVP